MAQAPVCHVSVDEVINQPSGPQMPSIPPASDLASALQAIAALTQIVNQLAGRLPNQSGNGTDSRSPKQKLGRYQEVSRSTSKAKVTNPEDPEQFVEVERINRLVFVDTVTGEQWQWSR